MTTRGSGERRHIRAWPAFWLGLAIGFLLGYLWGWLAVSAERAQFVSEHRAVQEELRQMKCVIELNFDILRQRQEILDWNHNNIQQPPTWYTEPEGGGR